HATFKGPVNQYGVGGYALNVGELQDNVEQLEGTAQKYGVPVDLPELPRNQMTQASGRASFGIGLRTPALLNDKLRAYGVIDGEAAAAAYVNGQQTAAAVDATLGVNGGLIYGTDEILTQVNYRQR